MMTKRSGGFTRTVGELRAERIRLAILRGWFVAVVAPLGFVSIWTIPWIPVGMTASSYDVPTAIAIATSTAASLGALAFVIVWAPMFSREPLPEFLRVLLGAKQLIRGRQQFYSRFAAECRRVRRDRRQVFSLVVIEQVEGGDATAHGLVTEAQSDHALALAVRQVVRAEDVVGSPSPNEVWVIAQGVRPETRERLVERITNALLGEIGEEKCVIGASTAGVEGDRPDELFAAAADDIRPVERLRDVRAG